MEYVTGTEEGFDIVQVNRAVESAFADHGRGDVQMPPKVYITLPRGGFPDHACLSPVTGDCRCQDRQCPPG